MSDLTGLPGLASVLAVVISGVALFRGYFQGARDDASELGKLENRVKALEQRADAMDTQLADVKNKVDLIPAMDERVKGLDRLVNARMNTIEATLGRVENKLDRWSEDRSFKPAGG